MMGMRQSWLKISKMHLADTKRVHLTESKAGIPRILPIGVTLSEWRGSGRINWFNDQLAEQTNNTQPLRYICPAL